jgi:hypothetical protein
VYKITAFAAELFTISPAYRGKGTKTGATALVRPAATKQLELVAPYGATVPSGEVDIYYWSLPTMLRDMNDMVPFPTADVLAFRSMSRLPTTRKLRPISQTQVREALLEAQAINPDKPRPRLAKNLQGTDIDFNRDHYRPLSDGRRFERHPVYDTWQKNRI